MTAEFCIKIKVDYPSISDRQEMTRWVNTLVGDIQEHLDEDVMDVELLNHTLVFRG
jgi:hypothetical protein